MTERRSRDSLHDEDVSSEFRLRATDLVEPYGEIEWMRQMPYDCRPFKPTGMRLEDLGGGEPAGWEVVEIKIGVVSQLPSAMPYVFLKEVLRRRHPVVLDTIHPSLPVTVRLRNLTRERRSAIIVFEGKEIGD